MAEEKSIIEILERQIVLIKEQGELTDKAKELSKKQDDVHEEQEGVQEELNAIQEIVKIHIKGQKELHNKIFDKTYSYDKKGKAYTKAE